MYFSVINISVLLVLSGMGTVASENVTCKPVKVLYNYPVTNELYSLKMNLVKYSKPYLHILHKLSLPSPDGSNSSTVLQDTKIYNLTQLELKGDAYTWTDVNNTEWTTLSITLPQMNITFGSLHYLKKPHSNQKITLDDVTLSVETKTVFANYSCSQSFPTLKVLNVKLATWNKNSSITSYVNAQIVPFVNKFLSSPNGMNFTNAYFNKCNLNASNNLMALLQEPYSSSGSHLYPFTTIVTAAFFFLIKIIS